MHTINSLTFTARNPIFSGRHVFFFFFGLCAEMTIYVPNTVMCNLGDLVSSLVSCNLDNILLTVLYPVGCLVLLTPPNTPFFFLNPP